MRNSVNFSGFVDLLRYSSDDFEPYGYSEMPPSLDEVAEVLDVIDEQCHMDDFYYD